MVFVDPGSKRSARQHQIDKSRTPAQYTAPRFSLGATSKHANEQLPDTNHAVERRVFPHRQP